MYELYQLSQLINEPTRITATSATLLDHIFGIRKIHFREKKKTNIIEVINMERFNEQRFLEDLMNQPWEQIYFFAENPDSMWQIWKQLFLD